MVKTTSSSNTKSETTPVVVPAVSATQTLLAQQQAGGAGGQHFKVDFTDSQVSQIQDAVRAVVEAAVRGESITVQLPSAIEDAPIFGMFVTLRRPKLLRACRGRWGVAECRLRRLVEAGIA